MHGAVHQCLDVVQFPEFCFEFPSPLLHSAPPVLILTYRYSSPLTRAKMCEIALTLAPLVQRLDFEGGDPVICKELQCRCVREVRPVPPSDWVA